MTSINNPSGTEPLRSGLVAVGVSLDDEDIAAFEWLTSEIQAWNHQMNLTSITDSADIMVKHMLDSLTVVPVLDRLASGVPLRIVDVGSGAGFPGLPIKIARRTFDLTLIEATGKKATFLQHAVHGLGLSGVEVIRARAEDVAREPRRRESFDIAVARAVANVATLAELLLPLVRVGGSAILMKTRAGLDAEMEETQGVWRELGAATPTVVDVSIPGLLADRALLLAKKIEPTASRWPRRPGIPQRRPLVGH